MKKILLITMVMLVPTVAFAQPGTVSIYADVAGADCNIVDAAGLLTLQVVHLATSAASAVQFSAPTPACFTGTFLSDVKPFAVTVGGSQTGVAVGYGGCLSEPINALGISYFADGLTGICCAFPLLPDPTLSTVLMADCAAIEFPAAGGTATINGNLTCPCGIDPVEESTWGSIKNIFNTDDQ